MTTTGQFDYTSMVDTCQPLSDKSSTGKERPWTEHRRAAELLSVIYTSIDGKKAYRVRECAPLLGFIEDPDTGKKKLKTAWFCRVRLCPVCQWRRSLKIYGQAIKVIAAADKEKKHGWIMLTLTVKNVEGIDLDNEIDLLVESWRRLTRSKEWKTRVIGCMRSLEVTHNLKWNTSAFNTFHPHIHALLCVDTNYFSGHKYLSRKKWTELWRDAAKLDYDPQVYVTRVKGDNAKAIAEIAKYATKTGDYILPDDLDLMDETVRVLDEALAHRRLISWQGNLKKIKSDLGLDDIDEGDLINVGDDQNIELDQEHVRFYQWIATQNEYFAVRKFE